MDINVLVSMHPSTGCPSLNRIKTSSTLCKIVHHGILEPKCDEDENHTGWCLVWEIQSQKSEGDFHIEVLSDVG